MNEKLVINTNLFRKESEFKTKACVVEKAIAVSHADNILLGLRIMLAASEVPRIAQQFGLDTSVCVNMMSVIHTVNFAVNTG